MSGWQTRLLGREEIAERTVAFQFSRPAGFTFKAGQAIDIVLPGAPAADAGAFRHTFSLVRAPSEEDLGIATRLRNSAFKDALANLAIGAETGIEGPFGSLTLHKDRTRAALLVAGGIGVTPFMSMLRQAVREDAPRQLVLLYSNHRPEDSAWLLELQELAQRLAGFRLVPVMTAMERSSRPWPGRRDRIDAGLLRDVRSDLARPVCYVAGSPAMVAATRALLNESGVDDDDIRSEEFHGY